MYARVYVCACFIPCSAVCNIGAQVMCFFSVCVCSIRTQEHITQVRECARARAHTYTHTHACMQQQHTHVHTHAHTCARTHKHTHTHTHMHATATHTCTHTCAHTYTHTHTHTHVPTAFLSDSVLCFMRATSRSARSL